MDFFFHPKWVHFPIALLITAGGIYLWTLLAKDKSWLRAAFLIHILGWIGCVASVLTGRQAENLIVHTPAIQDLLSLHERLGYLITWLFAMLGIWMFLRLKKIAKWELILFSVLFWAGNGTMAYMGHLGGEMVYQEGAGVAPMKEIHQEHYQHDTKE
ncbi:MAG: DUF2231 domain-containing protein [Bacteroidota bacterium]